MSVRAFAVDATIPDNAAFTACEALQRIGLEIAAAVRTTIWLIEGDAGVDYQARIGADEALVNPNIQRLTERALAVPAPGEVWIGREDDDPTVARRLGARRARRWTAWRLRDPAGRDVEPALLTTAVERFLANPAFEVTKFA